MRMKNTIAGLGIGLSLVAMTPIPRGALALPAIRNQDPSAFLGDYTFQKVLLGVQEFPIEKLQAARIRIDEDQFTISAPNGTTVVRYELMPNEIGQPSRIMMVVTEAPEKERVGMHATGLIEKQGGTLRLIYGLQEGHAPKDFRPIDEQQHLIVLKTAKP